jgi:hypothetical protein
MSLRDRLLDDTSEGFHSDADFSRDMGDYLLPLGDDEEGVAARKRLRAYLQSANYWVDAAIANPAGSLNGVVRRSSALNDQILAIGLIVLECSRNSTEGVE